MGYALGQPSDVPEELAWSTQLSSMEKGEATKERGGIGSVRAALGLPSTQNILKAAGNATMRGVL